MLELPVSSLLNEPRDVRTIYPRRATVGRIRPGDRSVRLAVAPYETLLLETVPTNDALPFPSRHRKVGRRWRPRHTSSPRSTRSFSRR
jgi:hypothetical protein